MFHQDDSVFESGIENLQRFQMLFAMVITVSCLFNDVIVFILLRGMNYLGYFIVYSSLYFVDKMLFVIYEKPKIGHLLADLFDIGLFFRYKKNIFIKMIIRIILLQYVMICLILSNDNYYYEASHSIQICMLISFTLHLVIITARINVIFINESEENNREEYEEVQIMEVEDQGENISSSQLNSHELQQQLLNQNEQQLHFQQLQQVESTSSLSSGVTKPLIKNNKKTTKIKSWRWKKYIPSLRSCISFSGRLLYQICFQLLLVLLLKQSFIRSLIYIISKMLISFILNRIVLFYQQGPTFNYLILILAQFFYIVIDHGPFYQFFVHPYKVNNSERLMFSSTLFQINSFYQMVDVTSIFLMDYMITNFDISEESDFKDYGDDQKNTYEKIVFFVRATAYIILGLYQLCYVINLFYRVISYFTNRYRIFSSKNTTLQKVMKILSNSSSIVYFYGNIQSSSSVQSFFIDDQSSLIYNGEGNGQNISSLSLDHLSGNNNAEQNRNSKIIQNRNSLHISFSECFKRFLKRKYYSNAFVEIQSDFNSLMIFENDWIMFDERFHKIFLKILLNEPHLPYSHFQYLQITNDDKFEVKKQQIKLALNIRFLTYGMDHIQIQMNMNTLLKMQNLINPILLQIFTYYSLISKSLTYNPHIILYDLYF